MRVTKYMPSPKMFYMFFYKIKRTIVLFCDINIKDKPLLAQAFLPQIQCILQFVAKMRSASTNPLLNHFHNRINQIARAPSRFN